MSNIIYVGIDVHKDTNSVCMFKQEENRYFNENKLDAGAEHLIRYLEKSRESFKLGSDCQFVLGYEAGPTGFGLCRSLQARRYDCVIIAPSTIRKESGRKVKTDRKDAQLLASTLACNAYRSVYLPSEDDEATREFTRTRNTLARHLKKAKQNLLSFMLRIGRSYQSGEYWTAKHLAWLETVSFRDRMLQYSFKTYFQEIKDLQAKLDLMDDEMESIAEEPRYREKVDKLICFTGIQTHTALSLVCEIGDFERFRTAGEFSSYLGLVPGQDSSGQRVQYNRITKNGNSRLRLLLVEASKGIKRSDPYKVSKRILARRSGQLPDVVAYADRAAKRIKVMIRRLGRHGKNANVATVAAARELSCFIWGMMTGNIQ